MERYWSYNAKENNYIPTVSEPLSAFPTIVNSKQRLVWCRSCHKWEPIIAFSNNVLKAQCGKLYAGPFISNGSIFSYGFDVSKRDKTFCIRVQSQAVATDYRRLVENNYELDINKKRIFKDGAPAYERKDIAGVLCKEVTQNLIDEIGDEYKIQYGIKPSVTSSLKGFSLLLGYLLCPFNVNFYLISRHWGLNPYDADFTTLSSGDTSDAENEMFASLGIRPSKSVRKLYQKFPQGIISYAAAKDLGFTDVNLLMKSANARWYAFFQYFMLTVNDGEINYTIRRQLQRFIGDMLALTNQKTVWNSLDRTVNYLLDKNIRNFYVTDGIQMYAAKARHLTDREKRQVLSEGFNQYTHDFLMRRQEERYTGTLLDIFAAYFEDVQENGMDEAFMSNKNIVFELEQNFLDLEYKTGDDFTINENKERVPVSDEDRYCFYVARDSQTLRTIGSEMSNCVGWGYAEAVKERRSTIVYAKHKGKYKICIEVAPDFSIRQAFGPHNTELKDEAFEAYSEWCIEKNIVRKKAFQVRGAPN